MRSILIILLTVICLDAQGQTQTPTPGKTQAQAADSTHHPKSDSATHTLLAESPKGHIIWHDIKESAYDGGKYLSRPVHWGLKEWAVMGTLVGITFMFDKVDDPIARDFFNNNQGKFGDKVAQFGNSFYGNGIATGLTAATLYTVGLETNNSKLRVMGRHVIQSFVYAGITTTALKIFLGRERPFNGDGPDLFHGFSLKSAWNSLPSGHVTVASALSATLAEDIGNPWATLGLYTCAGLTLFGRLYSDQHWVSDTFVGGVIGTVAGIWVSQETEHYDNDETGMRIVPGLGNLTFVWPL